MEIAIRVLRLFLAGKTSFTAEELADLFGWSLFNTCVWMTESLGRADAVPIGPLLWVVCWVRLPEADAWCRKRGLPTPIRVMTFAIEHPGFAGYHRLCNVLSALRMLRLKATHHGA